jgi:hypothetical protein
MPPTFEDILDEIDVGKFSATCREIRYGFTIHTIMCCISTWNLKEQMVCSAALFGLYVQVLE